MLLVKEHGLEIDRKIYSYMKYLSGEGSLVITQVRCRAFAITAALKKAKGSSHISYWERREHGKFTKEMARNEDGCLV